MTREEALVIVMEKLPDFATAMSMSPEDWRAFKARNAEALKVIQETRPKETA